MTPPNETAPGATPRPLAVAVTRQGNLKEMEDNHDGFAQDDKPR